METIITLFNSLATMFASVEIITGVGSLLGLLASVFFATKAGRELWEWWLEKKEERYGQAVELLIAGVTHVFQTLYADVKSSGKPITSEDAKRLRNAAIKAALEFSLQQFGRDIVTPAIGEACLESAVEACVADVKSRNNLPT